jgi:hypothetical protein
MFQKFRRKPTTVEALKWDGSEVPTVVYDITDKGKPTATGHLITIQRQNVMIRVGEWIAKEADGIHHYPIADDVFQKIYDAERLADHNDHSEKSL